MRGEEGRGTSSIFFLMKRLRSVNRGGEEPGSDSLGSVIRTGGEERGCWIGQRVRTDSKTIFQGKRDSNNQRWAQGIGHIKFV
jgi:hypothetical protein